VGEGADQWQMLEKLARLGQCVHVEASSDTQPSGSLRCGVGHPLSLGGYQRRQLGEVERLLPEGRPAREA
jgi:hypothetical protein